MIILSVYLILTIKNYPLNDFSFPSIPYPTHWYWDETSLTEAQHDCFFLALDSDHNFCRFRAKHPLGCAKASDSGIKYDISHDGEISFRFAIWTLVPLVFEYVPDRNIS